MFFELEVPGSLVADDHLTAVEPFEDGSAWLAFLVGLVFLGLPPTYYAYVYFLDLEVKRQLSTRRRRAREIRQKQMDRFVHCAIGIFWFATLASFFVTYAMTNWLFKSEVRVLPQCTSRFSNQTDLVGLLCPSEIYPSHLSIRECQPDPSDRKVSGAFATARNVELSSHLTPTAGSRNVSSARVICRIGWENSPWQQDRTWSLDRTEGHEQTRMASAFPQSIERSWLKIRCPGAGADGFWVSTWRCQFDWHVLLHVGVEFRSDNQPAATEPSTILIANVGPSTTLIAHVIGASSVLLVLVLLPITAITNKPSTMEPVPAHCQTEIESGWPNERSSSIRREPNRRLDNKDSDGGVTESSCADCPACPICWTPRPDVALACGHLLCAQCFLKCHDESHSGKCPKCRQRFSLNTATGEALFHRIFP